MTSKEILHGAITLIITTIGFSCNQSNLSPDNPTKEPINFGTKKNADSKILSTYHEDWEEMRTKSNKLVYDLYLIDPESNRIRDINTVIWKDSTVDERKILKFNSLLNDAVNHGYCCCPDSHYSVSFCKNEMKLGTYYVDTTYTQDKAMFFDDNYQTSYFIELADWNSIIRDN